MIVHCARSTCVRPQRDASSGAYTNSANTASFLVRNAKYYYGDYLQYQMGRQFYHRMGALPEVLHEEKRHRSHTRTHSPPPTCHNSHSPQFFSICHNSLSPKFFSHMSQLPFSPVFLAHVTTPSLPSFSRTCHNSHSPQFFSHMSQLPLPPVFSRTCHNSLSPHISR